MAHAHFRARAVPQPREDQSSDWVNLVCRETDVPVEDHLDCAALREVHVRATGQKSAGQTRYRAGCGAYARTHAKVPCRASGDRPDGSTRGTGFSGPARVGRSAPITLNRPLLTVECPWRLRIAATHARMKI